MFKCGILLLLVEEAVNLNIVTLLAVIEKATASKKDTTEQFEKARNDIEKNYKEIISDAYNGRQ